METTQKFKTIEFSDFAICCIQLTISFNLFNTLPSFSCVFEFTFISFCVDHHSYFFPHSVALFYTIWLTSDWLIPRWMTRGAETLFASWSQFAITSEVLSALDGFQFRPPINNFFVHEIFLRIQFCRRFFMFSARFNAEVICERQRNSLLLHLDFYATHNDDKWAILSEWKLYLRKLLNSTNWTCERDGKVVVLKGTRSAFESFCKEAPCVARIMFSLLLKLEWVFKCFHWADPLSFSSSSCSIQSDTNTFHGRS